MKYFKFFILVLITSFLVISGCSVTDDTADEEPTGPWTIRIYLDGSGQIKTEKVEGGTEYSFFISILSRADIDPKRIAVWADNLDKFIGFTNSGSITTQINEDTYFILFPGDMKARYDQMDDEGGNWFHKKREIKVKRQDIDAVDADHVDAMNRMWWNSNTNPETGAKGAWDQFNDALKQSWDGFPEYLAKFTKVTSGEDLWYGLGDYYDLGWDGGHGGSIIFVNYGKMIESNGNQLTDVAFKEIATIANEEIHENETQTSDVGFWTHNMGKLTDEGIKALRYCFFKKNENANLAALQGMAVVYGDNGSYTIAGPEFDILGDGFGGVKIVPKG